MKSYRSQFPSVGPKTIEKLNLMGITTREQMMELGSLTAMDRYLSLTGGWQKGASCSCLTYQFEGIIRNCAWHDIPDDTKKILVQGTQLLKHKHS